MKADKPRYHHGNLRAALVRAAEEIIRENGIEAFSLREAARRANVSAGAPTHHFGNAKGLLTEVALLGYQELGNVLSDGAGSVEPEIELQRMALAYIKFALDHTAQFRLMFRNDLVDRTDPRYREFSLRALKGLGIAAQGGGSDLDLMDPSASIKIFSAWSIIHGMAHLIIEGKAQYIFPNYDEKSIIETIIPKIVGEIYD